MEKHRILLGVSGSISAYKSAELARLLQKQNCDVRVAMTHSATRFISALTLQNLTRNDVAVDMFDSSQQKGGSWHIHWARWCSLMVIAPCSASTLARLACGLCDTTLSALAISLPRDTPLLMAPAMDTDMWNSPVTQRNVQFLESMGAIIIPPESGELASGLSGLGRLPEPETIVDIVLRRLEGNSVKSALELKDKKILITAGPTHEKLDPIRFLGNYSSGKMGFAIAEEALAAGADVTVIAGPVHLELSKEIQRINVVSAQEMYNAAIDLSPDCDVVICAAAVADFSPVSYSNEKIKKEDNGDNYTLTLKKNPDILRTIASKKKENQVVVGFALETSDEIDRAQKKMLDKGCDLMIANSAVKPQSGFGGDYNTIAVIEKNGESHTFPAITKKECAVVILQYVVAALQ